MICKRPIYCGIIVVVVILLLAASRFNKFVPKLIVENYDFFYMQNASQNAEYCREAKSVVGAGGYVIGWDFHEGQTCAARNMLGLIHWASDLNLTVVEPCVYNSYFNLENCVSRLNQCSSTTRPLLFRDYFDIDYWNNQTALDKIGPPLLPWTQFIKNIPNQAIIVYTWPQNKDKQASVFIDDEIEKDAVECYHAYDVITKNTRPLFTKETFSKLGIHITREVCFRFHEFVAMDVQWFNRQILGDHNPSHVLIVFTRWSGAFRGRTYLNKIAYTHMESVNYLKPSKSVVEHSKKYSEQFLGGDKYVAVHLRTIKIALILDSQHKSQENIVKFFNNQCSQQVSLTLQEFKGSYRRFLALDLGKYGDYNTRSFQLTNDSINKIVSGLLSSTYGKDVWNQSQWEDSFAQAANGITDSGYIAMMQKVLVSKATCIVTGGVGQFHNSLMKEYRKMAKDPCIKEVCKPK